MNLIQQFFKRLGPGLITASVVLGPGSIIASSRAGAEAGYGLIWVIVAAGILMATYTAMGARLGCALDTTPLAYLSEHRGRILSVLVGLSAFFVCAGFQFGNNLGVSFAVSGVTGTPLWIWPIVFTGLSLAFLFFARHVYVVLERLMMLLVAVMIVCFVTNLFFTGISVPKLVAGLVPRLGPGQATIAAAMLATNFSIIAALYQAYLVRAKGWNRDNLGDAVGDAWTGIAILGTIVVVIMIGAAQTLFGTGADFKSAGDLANQFGELLGPFANVVFCLGLGAASFSSFIVNACAGGAILADGLGLDARMEGKPARILAAICMVIGCVVGITTLLYSAGTTTSVLLAQASTLIAAPLAGIILLVITSSKKTMGDLRNGPVSIGLGIIGLAMLGFLFWRTLTSIAVSLFG
ncbi:MAG: Nramp family divalent metal transporter [Candidatus Hydrogenedentes bacterium]|nr:Nramp family divalent metal transporter [Candidatus Hydrogenedentota bacterium]